MQLVASPAHVGPVKMPKPASTSFAASAFVHLGLVVAAAWVPDMVALVVVLVELGPAFGVVVFTLAPEPDFAVIELHGVVLAVVEFELRYLRSSGDLSFVDGTVSPADERVHFCQPWERCDLLLSCCGCSVLRGFVSDLVMTLFREYELSHSCALATAGTKRGMALKFSPSRPSSTATKWPRCLGLGSLTQSPAHSANSLVGENGEPTHDDAQ